MLLIKYEFTKLKYNMEQTIHQKTYFLNCINKITENAYTNKRNYSQFVLK